MVSLNIYKNSANKFGRKTGFKIENEIEDHNQSIPKLIGILTQVFCTFGPNLVILAWTGDELSYREAQNGVTFDFEVKFDLEGQGQSPPKTIGILTKVFYTFGLNLVILAWTGDELSRGQASDYRTHGRTDTQTDAGNDNTRRPKLASGKKQLPYPVIHIIYLFFFFHFDFKDTIKYTATLSKFLYFLWKPFFPGQTPVPPRSGTWILDLSHDPIWAIWLAEVRKFQQHQDRISNHIHYKVLDEITYPSLNFNGAAVEV